MKRVYVVGDSISMHYGPYLAQALQGLMAYERKSEEEAVGLLLNPAQGANGGDSSMVLAFLKAKLASERLEADVVVLNCGLWDLRTDPETGQKQIDLDPYRANLDAILGLLEAADIPVVWVRTTPCDEAVHNTGNIAFYRYATDVDLYNAAADTVMAAHGVPEIDLFTFTTNLGPDLYCDHVHFNEPVRAQQGAFIAGWLAAWSTGGGGPQ